jgi:predicted RNA binding protein YcfA (HicA-like mRNA interferase family)
MPKIPRDVNGSDLCKFLSKYGYVITRQRSSHIRLSSNIMGKTHQITIPDHNPIKIGTLNFILNDISDYLKIPKSNVIDELKK